MNLKEGFNNIVIVCQNFTGESDGIMVIAVLDTTPPDLVIDKPSEDQLSMDYSMTTGQNFVEFRGFTEEKAKVTVAGRQVQVRKDPITDDETKRFFFTEKVQLVQGLNEIEISACDENGNCRQYTYKITYDPKAGNGKTTKIELWLGKASMLVNGETVKLVTAPTASSPPLPKDLAGSTFMPIAEVAKALDVEVGWNGKDKKVMLTQQLGNGKKKVIELWIGKKTAKIDGKEIFIDSAKKLYPTIVGGKTLLPLRFVGDALGALVEYESKTKKITLTYPKP
ncbi:MAG TPA: stalk domain-containing protein [Caldisericia bacterium]|nr:stalk domain-containing protein [Caldisericia bacterium]